MTREQETEVLVVGAGPVGMLTALLLSENGIQVKIIDKEERTAAHSHACALHPRTLRLLDKIGLSAEVLALGRRIETVVFYEGESRHAEMKLSELPGKFPFLLVLPQNALENLFEEKLRRHRGITVDWNHRLSKLEFRKGGVLAMIDKLSETSTGYIVSTLEWEVEKTLRTNATFVVGADGYDSVVRQSLGIECEHVAGPETFALYEFESDGNYPNEVRIVLDDATTNVFWPLAGNRCRWSLQVPDGDPLDESHSKERSDVLVMEQAEDVKTLQSVQRQIRERAPWFEGSVKELDWSIDVQFEKRMAQRFGQDRCWLVGDAAHQTSPIGMQSMNVGLCEAEELAADLTKTLRGNAPLSLLAAYDHDHRAEWQRLLGVGGGLKAGNASNRWVKERHSRILSCVPGSGQDLACLVGQLGLDFQTAESAIANR